MLHTIKTEELLYEIVNRCSDQLQDPEPQYDGVLSFLDDDELDWMMGELLEKMTVARDRTSVIARR